MIESVRTPEPRVQGHRICPVCDFWVTTSNQGKICDFGKTPVTSSSPVPTSTSNESHTRSDELRSFQIHHPRVSHSCRRASPSFQIRNSRSRSTEDKQPPCSASTTTRSRGKELNGAPLPCLPCFCSVSCAQLSFMLEPDDGLCARMDERTCMRVITVDVTSSVQAEKKCSAVAMWMVRHKQKSKNQKKVTAQVRRLKGGVRPSGFSFFPFVCFCLFLYSGAQNLFFPTSIAARFLPTFFPPKSLFGAISGCTPWGALFSVLEVSVFNKIKNKNK